MRRYAQSTERGTAPACELPIVLFLLEPCSDLGSPSLRRDGAGEMEVWTERVGRRRQNMVTEQETKGQSREDCWEKCWEEWRGQG